MSYLIDASNLGGVLGGKRGSRDPEAVVKFILAWARQRGTRGRMKIVFDGSTTTRLASDYGGLEVVFGEGKSADDVIRAEVARAPRKWTVVTDDAALGRACRDLGSKVVGASALAAKVINGPHPGARRAPLQGEAAQTGGSRRGTAKAQAVAGAGTRKSARRSKPSLFPHPESFSTPRDREKPQSSTTDKAYWKKIFDPDPE